MRLPFDDKPLVLLTGIVFPKLFHNCGGAIPDC